MKPTEESAHQAMTDADYLSLQCQLILLANLIEPMNLTEFIHRIDLAHAIGPIVEPTIYAKAREHLVHIERIARAARAFQKETRDSIESARAIEPPSSFSNDGR